MLAEWERVAMREPEPGKETSYDKGMRRQKEFVDRQLNGQLVIHDKDRQWETTRQGRIKFYAYLEATPDTVLQDFKMFVHDVRRHSGKHVHQGGLIIYVLEGEGWTVIDGERVDWEAGDMMLLPIKPGGVEHQHFNKKPDQGCRWLAIIYYPFQCHLASELKQQEEAPKE